MEPALQPLIDRNKIQAILEESKCSCGTTLPEVYLKSKVAIHLSTCVPDPSAYTSELEQIRDFFGFLVALGKSLEDEIKFLHRENS